MLFLLLSLILQVVQIHGQDEVYGCRLVGRDSDFGQDYYDWISVRSLRACQNKCLDLNEPCSGFTYVHNNRKYLRSKELIIIINVCQGIVPSTTLVGLRKE